MPILGSVPDASTPRGIHRNVPPDPESTRTATQTSCVPITYKEFFSLLLSPPIQAGTTCTILSDQTHTKQAHPQKRLLAGYDDWYPGMPPLSPAQPSTEHPGCIQGDQDQTLPDV
ncbi:unnamed protein product [Pleuronectes platessa]|uniref:Uncharacterized protein n=1 Tax=Pleuronectes platessa TaxID=8262 RepID=A0A9N7Z5S4_PLEPL|nr:unnamed protein product [Pleuronectes platessa]